MRDHKTWVSEVFDRTASGYGKGSSSFFNYFGHRLVEQATIAAGQRVLDVATDRGAVLFPLSSAVGPLGKVIGIDLAQQMLKETAKEIRKRGIHWADLQCMDAEQLDFPDHFFDAVFCGFALFFLPSIPTALSEFKRVLKSEGTLAVSTWGNDSELDAWINEEIKKLRHTTSLTATPLWSEIELRKRLENAGFTQIQIFEETKMISHPTSKDWWNSLWTHGIRAKLEQLSPDQIATLREKAMDLSQGEPLDEKLQVFYGIAKNPKMSKISQRTFVTRH